MVLGESGATSLSRKYTLSSRRTTGTTTEINGRLGCGIGKHQQNLYVSFATTEISGRLRCGIGKHKQNLYVSFALFSITRYLLGRTSLGEVCSGRGSVLCAEGRLKTLETSFSHAPLLYRSGMRSGKLLKSMPWWVVPALDNAYLNGLLNNVNIGLYLCTLSGASGGLETPDFFTT